METKVWLGHDAQQTLYDGICPFCDCWLEWGHLFQQEDGREGGLMTCPACNLEIAWIDGPFECTVKEVKE